jgi:glutathione S-transferase
MDNLTFVDLEEARSARGVRMLAAAALPSPWTEAAKGIFHVKQIPVRCVRFRFGNAEQAAWSGVFNVPAVLFDDEPPRAGWAEILSLAERLGGAVSLVPAKLEERVRLFGLAHELAGENGLGWSSRLIMVHGSLSTDGARSFPLVVAQRLAASYGYAPERFTPARARVVEILALFDGLLAASRAAGHPYLLGDRLTALDLYLAAFLTPVVGVTAAECPALAPPVRPAFEYLAEVVGADMPSALVEHRRMIFREHLPWPIVL